MRPLALLCMLAAGCASTDVFVYHPAPHPAGHWEDGPEDAHFASADGTRLHGWFLPAAGQRHVVLYCHGNAGNVTGHRAMMRFYAERLHASILVFDYRGYGKSEGTPGEEGVLADARAARAWVAERAGEGEGEVVLVGRSLGGGVACRLASETPCRALVLESTFTSVPDAAASHFPLLPVSWLLSTRLDSLSCIGRHKGPLLVSHGDADRTIPFALGKRLYEAAGGPKHFVRIPDGGHNDPPTPEYLRELRAFFTGLSGGTS